MLMINNANIVRISALSATVNTTLAWDITFYLVRYDFALSKYKDVVVQITSTKWIHRRNSIEFDYHIPETWLFVSSIDFARFSIRAYLVKNHLEK